MTIVSVVGARPNFMKIAPIIEELKKYPHIKHYLVHTGQHYSPDMAKIFFEELKLPKPNVDLGVTPGSHAEQTAEIMTKFEQILKIMERPNAIIVVGDVNSTLAAALTAVKLGIPIAHVEAGLRSFNWVMPEEINRVITDRISDFLFTTERTANDNLIKEGIPSDKIHFVGNVMIDTLLSHRKVAEKTTILDDLHLRPKQYAVMTLHRAELVDHKADLKRVLLAVKEIQRDIPIIWPIQPRTQKRMKEFGFEKLLAGMKNLRVTAPQGYLEFLNLTANAKLVLTDSGGIQEETTVLGVSCLTLRNETERPVTVTVGTNTIVGIDRQKIIDGARRILKGKTKKGKIPELWDGRTAERIIKILLRKLR